MASISKRGKRYLVRWRDPDGTERGRRTPDHETARRLARDVERAVALGEAWAPADAAPSPALVELDEDGRVVGGLFADYLDVALARLAPRSHEQYDRGIRRFVVWLAERHPRRRRLTVELLSLDHVEAWFGSMRETLSISAATLYLKGVYAAWDWAWESDAYEGIVSRPRRFRVPQPVGAPVRAPTWSEMDAAIGAAYRLAERARNRRERQGWEWRARLCTLLRFTGLRVDEQVMQLRWEDFDLPRRELTIRGTLGKSARERSGRIVPLSPHLAAEMAGWGTREGLVLAPWLSTRRSRHEHLRQIWVASGVPEAVWGTGSGRGRSQVHHCFRKGFKTGLLALGADPDVRDFLVGHHRGINARYVDAWAPARQAVDQIPPVDLGAGNIAHLQGKESS